MPTTKVKIEFPIHVSHVKVNGQNQYQIKPLFFELFAILNRRFEFAINKFQKTLKYQYSDIELDRDSLSKLNWFRFSPEINFKIYDLLIPLKRKQFFKGKYGIAVFELQGHYIACLPQMHSFMFLLEKNEKGKINVEEQATKVIQKLMERYRDYEGDEFDINNYTSTRKEFVNSFQSFLYVKPRELKFFQEEEGSLFDFLAGDIKMNGASEIWNMSKNLNHQYPTDLNRAFFQEEMVERLRTVLFLEPFKNTPIAIIGEDGVGKHTIVHETLSRYIEEKSKIKAYVQNLKRIREMWHIDPNRIITGMSIVGMWQKRLESVLKFVKDPSERNKGSDIILIDNPVSMLRIGQSASSLMNVNNVLKPYLEKRTIQVVVLATPEEWKVIQEKDIRFADLFQVIRLEQPDMVTAVKMALQNRKELESRHNSIISVKAIQGLFDLRRSYLRRKALPGSVTKIMRQLAIKFKNKTINLEQVRSEFESVSGLNQEIFDSGRSLEKDEIHKSISAQLVGQDLANQTLTNVIHTMKARMSNPRRPLGSFMFIGPTGVGKTQAAKVLCKYLTGSEGQLLKFDMNEFIDHGAVERLIGSTQNPDGILTGKVRFRPFGVILLDEIEKAHPKVHDILLQILDDARLTDSLGRTIDFSNTIIIMTSNIGAQDVSSQVGFTKSTEVDDRIYRKAVESFFRPEFVNRIDDIVVFNPLSLEHILDIAKLQINELLARDGFVRRTTILNISSEALEWVANRGFDERMGGRALKRQIEKDLTALTAEQLVGTYSPNPILFEIFLKKGKLFPRVSKLEFIEPLPSDWFPNLPNKENGTRFYSNLSKKLKRLKDKIDDSQDGLDDPLVDISESQFFLFKLNLSEVLDDITDLSLAFNDKNYNAPLAAPLRLKLLGRNMADGKLQDILFKTEGQAILNDAYSHTNPSFNSMDSEFMNYFLDTAFLMLFSKKFIKQEEQSITIHFESCIEDAGQAQIEYLINIYADFLDHFGLDFKVNEKSQQIEVDGYNLLNLFFGEQGIHLFQLPYQNPIPIRVFLKHNNRTQTQGHKNGIIRVYNDKNIIDLRTIFFNPINILPRELALFIYSGIKEKIRKKLV